MAQKRMNLFDVNVGFPLADGTVLHRKIAERALTHESAVNKVKKHYTKKGWKFDILSVTRHQMEY